MLHTETEEWYQQGPFTQSSAGLCQAGDGSGLGWGWVVGGAPRKVSSRFKRYVLEPRVECTWMRQEHFVLKTRMKKDQREDPWANAPRSWTDPIIALHPRRMVLSQEHFKLDNEMVLAYFLVLLIRSISQLIEPSPRSSNGLDGFESILNLIIALISWFTVKFSW